MTKEQRSHMEAHAEPAKRTANVLERRELARQHFVADRHAEAEAELRLLLDAEFEEPCTRSLLARTFLSAGRDGESRQEVGRAWEPRNRAPTYVVCRLLFFQFTFAALDGQDTRPFLARLKPAQTVEAHTYRIMHPVLDRLQPRLAPADHAILTALVAAVSDARNVAALDAFPVWRDAVPAPFD